MELLLTLLWVLGGIFAINYVYYRYLRNTFRGIVNFIAKRLVAYVVILALAITICWFWALMSRGDVDTIYIFGHGMYWGKVALWVSLILYVLITAWEIVLAIMGFVVGGALLALVCLIAMPFGYRPGKRKNFCGSKSHKKAIQNYRHVAAASTGGVRF